MTAYLLVPPASEPVSLAEAKTYLRVDNSDEDALITTLIAAARMHVEGTTGRALIEQTWRVLLDDWPVDRMIELPVAPLRSLTAVRAYDADGDVTAISLAQFQPETATERARLILPNGVSDSPVLRDFNGIEVDYIAGYADAPTNVPDDLKRACLVLIGHWFEHRDAVFVAGSGAIIPDRFDELLRAYKQVRL